MNKVPQILHPLNLNVSEEVGSNKVCATSRQKFNNVSYFSWYMFNCLVLRKIDIK